MISEIDGLTKGQLFFIEGKLNKIPKQETKRLNEELKVKKKSVRVALYECRYCAEAKMKPTYDRYTDTMDEDFQAPCKAQICPYRGDFLRQARKEPPNGINLSQFAEKYLKNFSK